MIFFFAQLIGLHIISQYVDIKESASSGETVVHEDVYLIAPPEIENESYSWIYISFAIFIGTVLILILIKYKLLNIWKIWFTTSVGIALLLAIYPYIELILKNSNIAYLAVIFSILIVVLLTYFKLWKKNFIVHNITEILIYGGIASLFVPIINVFSVILLLLLISLYDAYAVWKSKHMITMANFQTESEVFAGLMIPYEKLPKTPVHKKTSSGAEMKIKKSKKISAAILGGGDIAFPLLFAGVVLKTTGSFWFAILISLGATVALTGLFLFSKKNHFYPAVPFITLGCLISYGIILIF